MLAFFARWFTPFNFIALLLLGGVLAFRYRQEKPLAIGVDREIVQFMQGPARPSLRLKMVFASQDGRNFAFETRDLSLLQDAPGDRAFEAVKAWIAGPNVPGAVALVSKDIALPLVFARKDGVVIDLPVTWRGLRLGRSAEWLLACGLTNTLLGLPGVKQVQFLAEGKPLETLMGSVSAVAPFDKQVCQ